MTWFITSRHPLSVIGKSRYPIVEKRPNLFRKKDILRLFYFEKRIIMNEVDVRDASLKDEKRAGLKSPSAHLRRPSRRVLMLCALAALIVAASFALAGCKYSDVLTQHTEDPDLGTLDEGADPIYQSNPDAEFNMDLANISVDDAEDEDQQVAVLPHYDPNAPDNGPTTQRKKSDETPHDEEASEGEENEEQEPDRDGKGTDSKSDKSKKSEDNETEEDDDKPGGEEDDDEEDDEEENSGGDEEDDEDDDNEDDGINDNNNDDDEDDTENSDNDNTNDTDTEEPNDTLQDDESNEPTESTDGGGAGDTVIVDPDEGTNDDTAKGTVAAVGEYATIAQMLGGAGALAACDQTWLDTRATDGCFAGELDRVEAAFSGDGTKTGSCDVDALIDTIQPSVVLWDSTANAPNLSESERKQLADAGIEVQAVPHIGEQTTEDYDVKAAVSEVASVLSGASGLEYDPTDVLAQYAEFHDGALKSCYDANKGFSYKVTDSSYIYLYQDTPLSGLKDSTTTRVATVYADDYTTSGPKSGIISQSMAARTLSNDGEKVDLSDGVALSASTSTDKYMLVDYYLQLAGVMNDAYDMAKPSPNGKRYILMPGSVADYSTSGTYQKRSGSSAFLFNAGEGTVESNWHALGDSDFNVVLVANDEIKDVFVKSAAKPDGLYHMDNPYRVIVVPTGIAGQWTEGHLDSFLMSLWSFRIQSDDNLSAAESYAQNFYSTFLRCKDWSKAVSNWDNSAKAG